MHIALVCPDMTGHLNPMTTLGNALQRRGHRVSLVATPASRIVAERTQLEFLSIGEKEHRSGVHEAELKRLARMKGVAALNYTGKMLCRASVVVQRDAPAVLAAAAVDAVVWDQVSPGGESVALQMELPNAMVCNALAIHSESAVPPVVTPWRHRDGASARARNWLGNSLIQIAGRSMKQEINRFRSRNGVSSVWNPVRQDGGKIQVAQQPRFFDFPRQKLPNHFHYTGPWHRTNRDTNQPFPWADLDGRPLIYASLGTLQNGLEHLFEAILTACANFDVQLILSKGGSDVSIQRGTRSGAIIVDYAPQLEILKRAKAIITHAGLNTALEAMGQGLPMVAIPITNDQPGVARRLEHLGVAECLSPRRATAIRIQQALQRILTESSFQSEAVRYQKQLRDGPGVDDAARLVEEAVG